MHGFPTEKTIISVLDYMRADMIREGREEVHHVEALLRAYGVDPATLYVPRKVPWRFPKRGLRKRLMALLGEREMTATELWRAIPELAELPPELGRANVYKALYFMEKRGVVVREKRQGRVWWRMAK
jgi:hypothetical protein